MSKINFVLCVILPIMLLLYAILVSYVLYQNITNNRNKGQDINIVINGKYLKALDFNDPFEIPDTLTILDIKNGYVKYSYPYKDIEMITSRDINKLRAYLKELK